MFNTDKIYNGYFPTYLGMASEVGIGGIICEIGVQRGGSLEMWQHLFPAGYVVGVDNDGKAIWPEGTVKIVAEQDSDALPELLKRASPTGKYNLIVEDASHDGTASKKTFELLWPLIRDGGWYVIEDWYVGIPGHRWYGAFGDTMMETAQWFLTLFSTPGDMNISSVEFKYGMIIIRKNA
jgi:cephalosporin hydroxylase